MSRHEAGKGDKQRPFDKEAWDNGYDRIFGQDKVKTKAETYNEMMQLIDEMNQLTNELPKLEEPKQ